MDITLLSEYKLKIVLDAKDLASLDICADTLCLGGSRAQKAFRELLRHAQSKYSFPPAESQLIAQVIRDGDDSCSVVFSAYPQGESLYCPLLFSFPDIDTLISASVGLFRHLCHRIYKSSLYILQGKYILIISPMDYSEGSTAAFLYEYGEIIGQGEIAAAYAAEHGQLILDDNAIDTIALYFE